MDFSDDEVLPAAKRAADRAKQRKLSKSDKIMLRMEDDDDDDEEDELDKAVYDIKGSDDSSEEDDEDQLTGLAAKMAKQAKYLKRKAGAAGIDEDDEEESEEEEDEKGAAWGKKKRAYYNGDNVDYEIQSDDEEAPLEEEEEALRLQRKTAGSLRPEDYGQDDDEDDDEEDEEEEEHEETLQEALQRKEKGGAAKKGAVEKGQKQKPGKKGDAVEEKMAVEKVAKDVNALSKQQQMAVIMSEAPELVGLLAELKEGLSEVKTKVEPLLEQVKAGDHATADGISYLEAKHLLLLSYCQCIVFYLLLKAEGRSVREHPVIARLVEIRMYLEKIRPIDKKLQYQIEKLLKAAKRVGADEDAAEGGKDGGLSFRPNPDLLVAKIDQSAEGGGVYRPPMMTPASMEDDEGGARERRNKMRASKDARRRAVQSSFVQELAADIEGRPEEVREELGHESQEMMRERARLAKRMEVEEDLMARVPLSREERKKFKHLRSRSSNGLLGMLDDFDDDVAGLVEMGDAPAAAEPRKPRPLMQAINEAGRPAKKVSLTSGDADLPTREDLGERRRKRELQGISRGGFAADSGEEDGDHGSGGSPGEWEEDPVYSEAKELRAAKLAAKAEKYQRKPGVFPTEEEEAEGKRNITREMEKNRGLTPHRNKSTKNPRKKYKVKFEKAVVRRKGQVREVKSQASPYGGEATGIKANISRSVRFSKG